MPDPDGSSKTDAVPETPLHAYKDHRDEELSGDANKLESSDPGDQQASELEAEGEPGPPPKR